VKEMTLVVKGETDVSRDDDAVEHDRDWFDKLDDGDKEEEVVVIVLSINCLAQYSSCISSKADRRSE